MTCLIERRLLIGCRQFNVPGKALFVLLLQTVPRQGIPLRPPLVSVFPAAMTSGG
jgi:hypothetical protein